VKARGRFESADEALGRTSRDADGSMSWGSASRGDEVFWGTLSRGWVGLVAGAIGVAAIVAVVVWLL
jgi:hypothetical protein